jgi:hypothetical protein
MAIVRWPTVKGSGKAKLYPEDRTFVSPAFLYFPSQRARAPARRPFFRST